LGRETTKKGRFRADQAIADDNEARPATRGDLPQRIDDGSMPFHWMKSADGENRVRTMALSGMEDRRVNAKVDDPGVYSIRATERLS
jgi:hypothetical protein